MSIDKLKSAQRHCRMRELLCDKVGKLAAIKKKLEDSDRELIRSLVNKLLQSGDASENALQQIAGIVVASAPVVHGHSSSYSSCKPPPSQKPQSEAKKQPNDQDSEEVSAGRRHVLKQQEDLWAKICERDVEEFHLEIAVQRRSVKHKEDVQRRCLDDQVSRHKK